MKFCANCFSDKELIGYISSSTEISECNVCGSKNQPVLNASELFDFFQELIDNFKIDKNGMPLDSKIQTSWNFFSSKDSANKILNFILPNIQTKVISPNTNVEYTDEIIENYSHWEVLKNELKWKNRFVVNIERLVELGWDSFFNTQYMLFKETPLFRARLHNESGMPLYQPEEMSCPPKESTSGGRANPSGIPYLYLSDNSETTIYEVRASYLDELSVGEFVLNSEYESIRIVDFTEDTSLFQPNAVSINKTIKGKLLRKKISVDLSKPMRRYDSELEYIPTQFICEFIKVFTGANGIRFNSSLHPEGNNIVIFDKQLMTCVSVKKVKINSVNLQGQEMKY
jgi:hypothetical protein